MKELGIHAWQTGPLQEVLQAQAEKGFAHVPEESTMQVLTEILGVGLPEELKGHDFDQELRLKAMSKLRPDWLDVDATKALHQCYLEEHPEAAQEPILYADLLEELITKFEATEMNNYDNKIINSRATVSYRSKMRTDQVSKYFKPKYGKKKGPLKKPPRYAMPLNPTAELATDFLRLHAPPSVAILQDDFNGRWRVVSESGEWRSISWTRRGFQNALSIALFQAYEFEAILTGVPAPFNMKELADEIASFGTEEGDE